MRTGCMSAQTAKLASCREAESEVDGFDLVAFDFEVAREEVVFELMQGTQVQCVKSVQHSSRLFARNVVGWCVVGQLSLKKLVLLRPARAVPQQGSARRVRDPHTQYTDKQLAFLKEHANRPPGSLQGGQLSQQSESALGEEFKLEPEQIIGWASSQEQKRKKEAARLLARKGMPNYDELNTLALEAELRKRKIKWGKKKDKGKRELLEDDDDRMKLTDGAGTEKETRKRKKGKGGPAGGAGRKRKKAKPGKKTGGQGRGRAGRKPSSSARKRKRSQGAAGCSGGRRPGKSARRDSRRINSP